MEIGKKDHIFLGDQQDYYLQVFQRKNTNGAVVFGHTPFPNIHKYIQERPMQAFNKLEKQDSFRHIFKSSVNMYESSGPQFLTTTTGIQSGPHAFDKSRLVMNFLTNLEVTEILCSLKLILEEKTS